MPVRGGWTLTLPGLLVLTVAVAAARLTGWAAAVGVAPAAVRAGAPAPGAPAPSTVGTGAPAPGGAAGPLQGRVILLDPGHGGRDNGGVGVGGVREKDVTLAVALALREALTAAGARVVLTREMDVDLRDAVPPVDGSRHRGELVARAAMAAQYGAQVLVSIHANLHGRHTPWQGAQTFWDPRGHPDSERLARELMATLREQTPTRRVHRPINQLVLARSGVPAATVEVGFLSNAAEERRLLDPAYQRQVARAIAAGLIRYLSPPP